QRKRLSKILRAMRHHGKLSKSTAIEKRQRDNSRHLYNEYAAELNEFPINKETALPTVFCPTRLGNIIYAYEQYPLLKYGLDAVFFWPRLWLAVDKDLREEIDNHQAQADGLVYLVTAFAITGLLLFITAWIDHQYPEFLLYKQKPAWEIGAAL